jgi:hypothetical protein
VLKISRSGAKIIGRFTESQRLNISTFDPSHLVSLICDRKHILT